MLHGRSTPASKLNSNSSESPTPKASGVVTPPLLSYGPPALVLKSLTHSLNIATLATWLSVGAFGAVGIWLSKPKPFDISIGHQGTDSESSFSEVSLGTPDADGTPESTPTEQSATDLAQPPIMPEQVNLSPLPDLPTPADAPAMSDDKPAAQTPATQARSPQKPSSTPNTANAGGKRSGARGLPNGNPGSTGTGGGAESSRLAAGRMPAPIYPAEARRNGQAGKVLIEFTIDTAGRVTSAFPKSPCPWPLLNEEAARTVRRWKFPPGPAMTVQRAIDFQLR